MKYTLEDKAAMAESRNISYGRIQVCLEYGLPLPPLVRSTRWPKGSAHIGEDVLPWDIPEAEEQKQFTQKPKTSKKKFGSGVLFLTCQHCGKPILSTESVRVYIHTAADAWPQGYKNADICVECANEVLPRASLKKEEQEPFYDDSGKKVPTRSVGRCSQCGKLHRKMDGAQVLVQTPDINRPKLHSYLCKECLPIWKRRIKL